MKISFLYNKIPWFGKYSGYEYVTNMFKNDAVSIFNASSNTLFKRILGKFIQVKTKSFSQTTFGIATGFIFLKSVSRGIKHILYLENNLHILSLANNRELNSIVSTIHLPFSRWAESDLQKLAPLKNCIFLYEQEMNLFSPYLPNAKLFYVRHGVKNSFFCPNYKLRQKNKILLVGHYLRDFDIFEKIYSKIKEQIPHTELHVIIPSEHRKTPLLNNLAFKEDVRFYENISDDELVYFYQSSSILLMPMKDSGASTAIVQAVACGLPIVTNDVGGIRSYGGNSIFPVFKNENIEDITDYAIKLLTDESYNLTVSNAMRNFSVKFLDWELIGKDHSKIYKEILAKK